MILRNIPSANFKVFLFLGTFHQFCGFEERVLDLIIGEEDDAGKKDKV